MYVFTHEDNTNNNKKENNKLSEEINTRDKIITSLKSQIKPKTNNELEIKLQQTQQSLSQNLLTLKNLQKYMRNKLGNKEFQTVVVKTPKNSKLGLKVKN